MTPLIQEGPRDARIVLVGEAPGTKEAATGKPFINFSGAGMILNKALEARGVEIDRAECFITNVCHIQPPGNDFNWFYKKANQSHYEFGVTRLLLDLMQIKPDVVVAMGNGPLLALTEHSGIGNWRGSILPCTLVPGLKVIATYHPAFALRQYQAKALIELDFRRIPEELALGPTLRYPERTLYLPDSTWSRPGGLVWENMNSEPDHETIAHEMLKADWLSVDIENWEDWKISCVGFSDRPDRALTLDWTVPRQREIARELCESRVRKVLQNGMYDFTVLSDNGVTLREYVWDTMIAHHTLLMESASGEDEMSKQSGRKRSSVFKKGLAFQTSINTREPYYKEDGKRWKKTGDIHKFWRYNGLDACVTRESRDVQDKQLTARKLWPVFAHGMSLVHPLMQMTARGIRIDMAKRAELRKRFEGEIETLTQSLTLQAGGDINVKSSKQAQALLYDRLGLPTQYNKKTGKATADKFAITTLAQKHKHPVLLGILRLRERRDFIERYLDAAVDADGRMRCSFDPTGTNTGRLSSRQSIYGSGTNLQNIPARRAEGRLIRRLFISDPGKVLLYADYSQAEARLVASYARCKALVELFNDPSRDVHSENASRIFNIPLANVGKDSLERFLAKQGVHAGNYGQGPKDMAMRINAESEVTGISVTERECADIQQRVNAIYPEIRTVYWRDVITELQRSRTLTSPFGRQRTFYDRWDDKLLRTAYAFKPQSGVGDLCCKALVAVYQELQLGRPELGVELFLNVHDALLLQCNDEAVETVSNELLRIMDIPVPVHGQDVHIPVDIQVGRNWDKFNKKNPEDNPLGLRDLNMWLETNH